MVLLGAAGGLFVAAIIQVLRHHGLPYPFTDYDMYRDAAARWLESGVYYLPHQLEGPYAIRHLDVLYPPPSLLLFVPTALMPHAVGAVLFLGLPFAALGYAVWRLRPAPWALVAIALCLYWPVTTWRIVAMNPVLWVMAAVALGTVRPFFAPFGLLKFTTGVWLFGAKSREWWAGLAVVVALAVLFLPMWPDYATALMNSNGRITRSLDELPVVIAPLFAWFGATRGRSRSAGSTS